MSLADRNTIPRGNSMAQTLLENWVEERGVAETLGTDARPAAQRFRAGHRGLLTTDAVTGRGGAAATDVGHAGTTTRTTFGDTSDARQHRTVGARRQQLERTVREFVENDFAAETAEQEPEMQDTSVTRADFTSDYVPQPAAETGRRHEVYGEPVASYWRAELENGRGVAGVSAIGAQHAPFRKNAAFTMPVEHALDDGQDH